MRKIAITGSSGFIGSNLVKNLKERNDVDLTLFSKSKHSLFDLESLKDLVSGCDVVFHLAGINDSNNMDIFDVNILGTQNLLEAVRIVNPKSRFVFISSFAVYKTPRKNEIVDEKFSRIPRNKYGLTKFLAEELTMFYSRVCGLNCTIFRISNAYGSQVPPYKHSVIATIIDQILRGVEIDISSKGRQTRDFIYVDDIVEAFNKFIDSNIKNGIFNVCSGNDISINQLISLIEMKCNKKAKVNYTNINDAGYWKGSFSLAHSKLLWKPQIGLDDGLNKILK